MTFITARARGLACAGSGAGDRALHNGALRRARKVIGVVRTGEIPRSPASFRRWLIRQASTSRASRSSRPMRNWPAIPVLCARYRSNAINESNGFVRGRSQSKYRNVTGVAKKVGVV